MEEFKIIKIKDGLRAVVSDLVVEEVPLTIVLNGKELVTLLCMPEDLEDLVCGFLYTCGLIKKFSDIKKMVTDDKLWTISIDLINTEVMDVLVFKRLFTSGCGRGALFYNAADIINRAKIISDFKIEAKKISNLLTEFQKKSKVYLKTGCAHSAALSDGNNILIFREDIGRHNAVDKIIGGALKAGMDFKNLALFSSGRISSEVLFKAQKAGIPIVISHSAPTNQAVRLAQDMDITLVGFARGERLNIYNKEERVA